MCMIDMDGELMKSAVTSYLKRRRYSDHELPVRHEPASSPGQSKQQMALMAVVDKEVTRSNSISFSSNANYSGHVELQFNRLKCWIAELKIDTYRHELAAILCPLFCHLYLEILSCNQRPLATRFLKRHFALFASREDNRKLLEELAKLASAPPNQEVELSGYVKTFRSSKYNLKLSSYGMLTLQKYLSEYGHVLILQAIQKWFDIEIRDPAKQEKEEDTGAGKCTKYLSENAFGECTHSEDGNEMKSVLDAIQDVRNNPSPLLLYVISNGLQNYQMQCCTTTYSMSMLAAGIDTGIKIWGLREELKNYSSSFAPIPLGRVIKCEDRDEKWAFDTRASSAMSLYGHAGRVQDVAFVPKHEEPNAVLSVSQDKTMRCWKLDNYECVSAYRGHTSEVWCIDVDSFGLSVATGSHDRTARLWSLERNFPLRTCAGHLLDIECVKFHPNNLYIATGSADKTVRMWSVNDVKLLRLFCGHTGAVQCMAFSPNGKFLCSAGEDKRIKIWDLGAGKLLTEFKGHTNTIKSLAWSPNSKNICSCSLDGSVRLWSLERRGTNSGDSSAANHLLCSYTIGSGLLNAVYRKSNTVVCLAYQ